MSAFGLIHEKALSHTTKHVPVVWMSSWPSRANERAGSTSCLHQGSQSAGSGCVRLKQVSADESRIEGSSGRKGMLLD